MNSASPKEQLASVVSILNGVIDDLAVKQDVVGIRRPARFINGEAFDMCLLYVSDGKAAGKTRDQWLLKYLKWVFATNPWINLINTFFNWNELLPYPAKEGQPDPYITPVPRFITDHKHVSWVLGDLDYFWKNPRPAPPGTRSETAAAKAARRRSDLIALFKQVKLLGGFGMQFDDLNRKLTKEEVKELWDIVEESETGLMITGSALATFPLTGWALHNEQYQIYVNEYLSDSPTSRKNVGAALKRWLDSYPATVMPDIGAYKDDGGTLTAVWNLEYVFDYVLNIGVKGAGIRNIAIYGQDQATDFQKLPDLWAAVCNGCNNFWLSRPPSV